MSIHKVPAEIFVHMLIINVQNKKMSDTSFREFVLNALPMVEGSAFHNLDNRTDEVINRNGDFGATSPRK